MCIMFHLSPPSGAEHGAPNPSSATNPHAANKSKEAFRFSFLLLSLMPLTSRRTTSEHKVALDLGTKGGTHEVVKFPEGREPT